MCFPHCQPREKETQHQMWCFHQPAPSGMKILKLFNQSSKVLMIIRVTHIGKNQLHALMKLDEREGKGRGGGGRGRLSIIQ